MSKSAALRPAVVVIVAIALVVGFRLWNDDASSAVQVLTADEEQEAAEVALGELEAPVQSSGERIANAPDSQAAALPSKPLIFVEQPPVPAPTERHLLVVERDSERPVQNARVLGNGTELAVTDVEGHASWAVAPGEVAKPIEVRAEGFGKVATIVDASCTDRENATRIELVRGAVLRGHVRGLRGMGPFTASVVLDGNDISAIGGFWPELRETSWSESIDAQGYFEFVDLPPEVLFELRWSPADGPSRRLQIELIKLHAGELRELEWDLAQHGGVDGIVVDEDGRGMAGVRVELQGNNHASAFVSGWFSALAHATSGADGRFHVEGLAAGEYLVGLDAQQAEDHAETLICATEQVVVPEGATTEVRLVVHVAAYIEGRVLGVDGEGVSGVYVHALGGANKMAFGMSGAGGVFRVGPLTPGPCKVASGGAFLSGEGPPPPLDVTAPASDVIIQLVPAEDEVHTGVLSGVILDAQTREPVAARAMVQWRAGVGRMDANTAGQSKFALHALGPDTYNVFAVTPDGRVGSLLDIHLAAGEERAGLEVLVQRGGEVHVSYPFMDDVFLKVTANGVRLIDHADYQDAVRSFYVPAGSVEVKLQRVIEGELEVIDSRTVEVLAGEVVEVDFED